MLVRVIWSPNKLDRYETRLKKWGGGARGYDDNGGRSCSWFGGWEISSTVVRELLIIERIYN